MGLFDSLTSDLTARKAYTAHVQGNRLSDDGKREEARAKHEEAIRLYEKCLFEQVGRRKGYYEAPKEDAILMTRYWKEDEETC